MAKRTFTRATNAVGDVWAGRRLGNRSAAHGIYIEDDRGTEVLAAEAIFRGFDVSQDPDDSHIAIIENRSGVRSSLNNTGSDVAAYTVVVNDPTTDDAFVTTSTAQVTERGIGVTQAAIAAGERGPVMFAGITSIGVASVVTRGEFVETSTTAGAAAANASRREGSFGVLLTGADPTIVAPDLGDYLIDSEVTVLTSAGTAMTVDMPATRPSGMLAVLQLQLQGSASSPSITGWTRIGSTAGFRYYYRVTTATEPATYAVAWTGSSKAIASVVILDQLDTASPIAGYGYDATTAAAAVSGLAAASYLALAGVDANPATPADWTPLAAGNTASGGGVTPASVVQKTGETMAFSGSSGLTVAFPAPVTPGNLLLVVEASDRGGYSTWTGPAGASRPFTTLGTADVLSEIFGTKRIRIAARIATGDEQTLSQGVYKLGAIVYEIANAADPSTFEVLALANQAAAGSKSLGAFGTAGDLQIAGFAWDGGSADQTAGTGYTADRQIGNADAGLEKFGYLAEQGTAGTAPSISGGSHIWGGVAVGIVSGTVDVASELVAQPFNGTGIASPFSGASAQHDAIIALALATPPILTFSLPLVLLWGGDADLGGGFSGVAEDLTTAETDTTKRLAPDGLGGVDWVAEAGGSTLAWFIPEDYGAAGDGTTDDTTAIDAWAAAFNAAGRGVLYAPNKYKTSGGHTLTGSGIFIGDGMGAYDGSVKVSAFLCTSQTAHLFTVTGKQLLFRDIGLFNTYAGTPSAGAAIQVSGSFIGQKVDLDSIVVAGFYVNIDRQVGSQWSNVNVWNWGPVLYGEKIQNTVNQDAGDWAITNSYYYADTHNATAGIRQEGAGGGKLTNVKFNGHGGATFTKSYDAVIASSHNTSVLTIVGSSFENMSGDAISIATTGTGRFSLGLVVANEFGLYSNSSGRAIKISAAAAGGTGTAGGIGGGIVASNVIRTDGTARAAIELVNTDRVTLGDLQLVGFNARYTSSGDTNTTDALGISFATPTGGYGTAAAGSAATALRSDAVFAKPTAADVDFSADVTTSNATTGHHGLLPKLDGNAAHALLGDGTYGAVAGTVTAAAVRDAGRWEPTVDGGTDTLIFDNHTVVMDWTTS